jgi:hypothetical protein
MFGWMHEHFAANRSHDGEHGRFEMSLGRKIALTVLAIVVIVAAILLSPELLWVKILLGVLFLVVLFWPTSQRSKSRTEPHQQG